MSTKKIHHVVTRPGKNENDKDVKIKVAEDIASSPGIPTIESDVSFYSREYPQEAHFIENSADRDWLWSQYTDTFTEFRKQYEKQEEPLIKRANHSGNRQPLIKPNTNKDYTEILRTKARKLGFNEVGFTKYDKRYTFSSRKKWVKYPNAICLGLEQEYEATQTLPSEKSEHAHFGTYLKEGKLALELAEYILSVGYHSQVHSHSDSSAPYIPMFVNAGLGQLGANGQLLSPHLGSRMRLMIITTDMPLKYDSPIDYGINKFCGKCQVCVKRCPSNALSSKPIWWRGVQKYKVNYGRCRAVMGRYDGCAICMKVCPVQKFGMEKVMDHYVETGKILGKGTNDLESYSLKDKGYFDAKSKPKFDKHFFEIPRGKNYNWIFANFRENVLNKKKVEKEDWSTFTSDLESSLFESDIPT